MASGNRSVLVVVDSRKTAARRQADLSVFAALDHFGVAYDIFECADYWAPPPGYLSPRALTILAHDGVASALPASAASEIAAGIRNGAGLVSFDRDLKSAVSAIAELLPEVFSTENVSALTVTGDQHFITVGHTAGEEVELFDELRCVTLDNGAGRWTTLAAAPQGKPLIVCGNAGDGRIVVFGTGDSLYDETVLGHTRGMDGFMWRSIVWSAQKPFPMRCMPPYVSARFDDCNGTHTSFGYVRILNRYGIRPNIGLFTDELGLSDWSAAKELHTHGRADFSMHAFRDDLYKRHASWRPFAVCPDKPDLSEGGKQVAFEGLSMDHTSGEDLPPEAIRANMSRADAQFAAAGITYSRILNAHFGEVGKRAIPYHLERGIRYPCNNSVLGQLYGHQPVWRPGPYALRGTNGRYGVVICRCREHPGMINVGFSCSHLGTTHMTTDILHGNVPFVDESPDLKPDEAVQRGIRNVRNGLDAMACGKLFTHEQRVHVIDLTDWETIIERIMKGLGRMEMTGESRETVSIVASCLLDTRLACAHVQDGTLHCALTGKASAESPLTVWENREDGCTRQLHTIAPFDGFIDFKC